MLFSCTFQWDPSLAMEVWFSKGKALNEIYLVHSTLQSTTKKRSNMWEGKEMTNFAAFSSLVWSAKLLNLKSYCWYLTPDAMLQQSALYPFKPPLRSNGYFTSSSTTISMLVPPSVQQNEWIFQLPYLHSVNSNLVTNIDHMISKKKKKKPI